MQVVLFSYKESSGHSCIHRQGLLWRRDRSGEGDILVSSFFLWIGKNRVLPCSCRPFWGTFWRTVPVLPPKKLMQILNYPNPLSYRLPKYISFTRNFNIALSYSGPCVSSCLLSHHDLMAKLIVSPPSSSHSCYYFSLYLCPLAGIGSPAFLYPLPNHRLNQLVIDKSEIIAEHLYITWYRQWFNM